MRLLKLIRIAIFHTVSAGYGKQLINYTLETKSGSKMNFYSRVLAIKRFKDVKPGFKDKRHIELIATMGYLDGDPDGFFRPNKLVTRGELMKRDCEKF